MLSRIGKYLGRKAMKIIGLRAVKLGTVALISSLSPVPIATFVGMEMLIVAAL